MTSARRLHRGFTLIEILIALAILSLLAVLGYRAVASLGDTEARLSSEAEKWRRLDGLFSRLESDCREAIPRGVRAGDRLDPAWLGTTDTDGNSALLISRAGPEFLLEPGSAGQRIGYRLRNGTLEVLYWPALDNAAEAHPAAYTLVADVAAVAFNYLDTAGAWRSRWPVFGEPAIPRGLQVVVRLASGERIERWIALQ
jgi:general secretion pathway protein J